MADVAHFISATSAGYFDAQIVHLEVGVGEGKFTIQPDYSSIIHEYPVDFEIITMDEMWIGINFNASPSDGSVVQQWDGVTRTWTRHYWINGSAACRTYIAVDANLTPSAVWAMSSSNGSPWVYLRYWDGTTWTRIWLSSTSERLWLGGNTVPTLYGSAILFTNTGTYGSGARLWFCDASGATQYTGGDLPTGAMYGAAVNDEGTFVLNTNGYVYKGDFFSGWSINNLSDGPFSGFGNPRSIRVSNTGQVIVAAGSGIWIRNDDDDWTYISTGYSGGQVSKVDNHILHGKRYSSDGGASFSTLSDMWGFSSNGSVKATGSSAKRLLTCGPTRLQRGLRWRGDHKYSPWATHPHDPDLRAGTAGTLRCMEGFSSGQIIISTSYFPGGPITYYETWHFTPVTETWSIVSTTNNRIIDRIFGTAYEAGKIHAYAIVSGQIHYLRWNGTNWDDIPITGSSSVGGNERLNISATPDGLNIWITAGVTGSEQLWHSSDGGSTWNNRYTAAAAVHPGGVDWPVDVVAVSPTEVYVCFTGAVAGAGISKWNGSTWSKMGDTPSYISVSGGRRSIFVDANGNLWLFGSGSTNNPIYKYTG